MLCRSAFETTARRARARGGLRREPQVVRLLGEAPRLGLPPLHLQLAIFLEALHHIRVARAARRLERRRALEARVPVRHQRLIGGDDVLKGLVDVPRVDQELKVLGTARLPLGDRRLRRLLALLGLVARVQLHGGSCGTGGPWCSGVTGGLAT